jgi:hypothetical protein
MEPVIVLKGIIYGGFVSVMVMGITSPFAFVPVKLFSCVALLGMGIWIIGRDPTVNEIIERTVEP